MKNNRWLLLIIISVIGGLSCIGWKYFYRVDQFAKHAPWYLHINELDVNDATKEFLQLTFKTALDIPNLTSNQISELDIQMYLEHNVPELMRTESGRYKIIEDLRKLVLIQQIEVDMANNIMQEYDNDFDKLPFNLKDETLRRTQFKINLIIKNFKAGIKY